MIWKYGIFCAILSGSVWGTFWQVILTILAILTTGLQLSLEIAPALFSGASIGFIYLIYQKNIQLKQHIIFVIITTFLISTLFANIGLAADVTVEMLNRLDKQSNVFEPKIVRVNVGDTVLWKAKDKGHNVEFIKKGVPEGVGKFKSKFNKDVEYKFEVPGIYAYWCTPHKNMGMIGFVVVGDDKSNLEAIKKLRFSSKSKKMAPDLINSL